MKQVSNLLFQLYSLTALVRQQVLVTIFGYKSECKHTPTCSRYTRDMIRQKGFAVGIVLGARRLATCW